MSSSIADRRAFKRRRRRRNPEREETLQLPWLSLLTVRDSGAFFHFQYGGFLVPSGCSSIRDNQ